MLHEIPDNLDALIREEKEQVALDLIEDAWVTAQQEGIESAIFADSALAFVLTRLNYEEGDAAVSQLIRSLQERCENGAFVANKSIQ
ncbi:MAG: hypothetical protein AAGM04_14035 [Pseudomonadota bacterium]